MWKVVAEWERLKGSETFFYRREFIETIEKRVYISVPVWQRNPYNFFFCFDLHSFRNFIFHFRSSFCRECSVYKSVHNITFFKFKHWVICRQWRILQILELMLQYGEQWLVKCEHILHYLHNCCMIRMGQQMFFILFCFVHVFVPWMVFASVCRHCMCCFMPSKWLSYRNSSTCM